MVENTELKDIYQQIKYEHLEKIGIEDDILSSVLAYRLLIERLGEKKNNNWWESRILDEFGRKSLEEIIEKSFSSSRIKLAMKVGRKAEKDLIDSSTGQDIDHISLFYLGPYMENKLSAQLDKINNDMRFDMLENLDAELKDSGWSDKLMAKECDDQEEKGDLILIDTIPPSRLNSEKELRDIVENLICSYGSSTKNHLKVPYYEVKNE